MATSLTILGTAGGGPIANRAKSGLAIKIDDRISLIDCGGGTYQSFVNLGFDPKALDRIVISHTHPDHVSDLTLFVQMVYLAGRTEPFTIHVPEEFVEPLNRLLEVSYLFESRFPCELLIEGYDYGVLFEKPFELEAIPNTHLGKFAEIVAELKLPNEMQCSSFDIAVNKTRVLYSSDIGSLDDILPHLDGHEFVLLESAHVDIEHFLTHAKDAKVGQFIMTHLLSEAQAGEIEVAAKRRGIGNLIVARDGMVIELP